jgi:hypothetical protein
MMDVVRSRRSLQSWAAHGTPISLAVGALAVGAYLVLMSAAISQLVGGFPTQARTIEGASDETAPAAQFVAGTPFDARLDAMTVPNVNSGVLTITVDGPNASVDVYCDPTIDEALLHRIHVTPDEMMDVFRRLCSRLPDS